MDVQIEVRRLLSNNGEEAAERYFAAVRPLVVHRGNTNGAVKSSAFGAGNKPSRLGKFVSACHDGNSIWVSHGKAGCRN